MSQDRLIKALAREGIQVERDGSLWRVRSIANPHVPESLVLLPDDLAVESRAFQQLLHLSSCQHPTGGGVKRVVAAPDFHPGDGGVAIGSTAYSEGSVTPAAVGGDICCGVRLHTSDLDVGSWAGIRNTLAPLLQGDFHYGTRDVAQSRAVQHAMFQQGLPAWWEAQQNEGWARGSVARSNHDQLFREIEKTHLLGSLEGDPLAMPVDLLTREVVRDDGLGTVGGGNHFIEFGYIEQILDSKAAYNLGLRQGAVTLMVHTGSRLVGKYVGQVWAEKARMDWQATGNPFPDHKLFPLHPSVSESYLAAEWAAANYGFVNRMLCAEQARLRVRQALGREIEMPLVYDVPHNITLPWRAGWLSRKGACPAETGQVVITPGSMGTASYISLGMGNEQHLCSASHGAGRAISRNEAFHTGEASTVDCLAIRPERIVEEAPRCYKDVESVVRVQFDAGIMRPVARLLPLLTLKA
jgi:tRNA-splicing ligase RtcB